MQDVDENMDELFRMAADNYMLKSGQSGWDAIAGRITPPVVPVTVKKANKPRKYMAIVLFTLLCLLVSMLFMLYSSNNEPQNIATKEKSNQTDTGKKDKPFVYDEKHLEEIGPITASNHQIDRTQLKNTVFVPAKTDHSLSRRGSKSAKIDTQENKEYYRSSVTHFITGFSVLPAEKKQAVPSIHLQQTPTVWSDSSIKHIDVNEKSVKTASTQKIHLKKNTRFYYGLSAGAGFSAVKDQEFSKPGLSVGLITGYHFAKASYAEISLLYSRKYYDTDGRYFNMDKMEDMPPEMKVMSVSSKSTILEIPLNFKYNILHKNSVIYGAAGFTSYILIHEKNDYIISTSGTMGSMQGNYKTTSGYFAGGINIAAGYEHAIGKNGTLRFEPYITIPTTGIGIGSLPITTSGIRILLTGSAK